MNQKIVLGDLVLSPPLALAPMVGLSHSALRSLIIELGGVGLLFTEMLSVKRLPSENTESPFLKRSDEERPLFYQLVVGRGQDVLPAVERLHRLDAQGIDLNIGCPAPKLRQLGAGCALRGDVAEVKRLVQTLRQATALPLSAKIRLGADLDEKSLLVFCEMLQGEGVDLLTVHGRLDSEKFCRKPRWDWIGKVKQKMDIPIIANGGIFSVEDARNCLEQSGADGLMIGRGAACRPWIFAEIARKLYGIQLSQTSCDPEMIYFRFVELLHERFRPERRLGRLKQFTHLYGTGLSFGHHLASAVQTSLSMAEAEDRAAQYFAKSSDRTRKNSADA
ncbi:MAG: tRNA-dihydrouridine synthase family protein [Desulfobulbaceae bacterium]|uniref:tRNA-dihydrouridine synthase n=1 Tax=Candidatus Desulfatifera sulfidica TaxID=2841691 RepID=A0A8J6NBM0_9BACT|nr:tRNA-dihydrouridine synthase family protein [Candidatus Desulfatifera sulfidica]